MTESKRGTGARSWQVTVNNPEPEDLGDALEAKLKALKGLAYACWAEEVGNNEGTHHVHIYLAYTAARYFSTIKNLFPRGHIEAAKGSPLANRAYIEKAEGTDYDDGTSIRGTFRELGELPTGRTGSMDWERVYEILIEGGSVLDVVAEQPHMIKFTNQIERLENRLHGKVFK